MAGEAPAASSTLAMMSILHAEVDEGRLILGWRCLKGAEERQAAAAAVAAAAVPPARLCPIATNS